MKNVLPQELLKRKKQGFMVPLGDWIKGPVKPLINELLHEKRIKQRGYFNPQGIAWMLARHTEGKENFTDQIWALLNLEIWHQTYMN
ncbi:MAG: asparagine synthase-related protein [bacterium]